MSIRKRILFGAICDYCLTTLAGEQIEYDPLNHKLLQIMTWGNKKLFLKYLKTLNWTIISTGWGYTMGVKTICPKCSEAQKTKNLLMAK